MKRATTLQMDARDTTARDTTARDTTARDTTTLNDIVRAHMREPMRFAFSGSAAHLVRGRRLIPCERSLVEQLTVGNGAVRSLAGPHHLCANCVASARERCDRCGECYYCGGECVD